MTIKVTLFTLTCILFFACTDSSKTDKQTSKRPNSINSTIEKTVVTEKEINNEDGPPFSDTCTCSFDYIARIRTSKKRFDLLISGKGWNPDFYSCSWVWGELINNEFPPDSNITDFRIHLVDIDKLENKLDSTFLNSRQFNDNLIATYSKNKNDKYMTCKFDPNKTGKYPKPKQWTEE